MQLRGDINSKATYKPIENKQYINEIRGEHNNGDWDWLKIDQMKLKNTNIIKNEIVTIDISDIPPSTNPSALTAASIESLLDEYGPALYLSPATSTTSAFPIIFDTGASLAISPCAEDFEHGKINPLPSPLKLGGMANGLSISGIGIVNWTFKRENETSLNIRTQCYYVKEARVRLLSPQRLFQKSKGINGSFITTEDTAKLTINEETLLIPYHDRSFLPVRYATNDLFIKNEQVNVSILEDTNTNLTPSQKLLLRWHYRYGHKNIPFVQMLFRKLPQVFSGPKFTSASRCEIPLCEICQYAKAHKTKLNGKISKVHLPSDGVLKNNHLRAGDAISVDHFESRLRGRSYTSFGKGISDKYIGGCIFVDHMSGRIQVEHQLGFSASETIRAKQNFEKTALDHGVIVSEYLADNGVFKANKFVKHIHERNQKIRYCGVNAHHQNGIAERSIRTVSEMSRALLLHASTKWKDGIDSSLWPMAVDYATFIYNNLPNSDGISPNDLFTGSTSPVHRLKDMHVWVYPVYVLDPTLQQGNKLPR